MSVQEFTNRKGCGGVILGSKNSISKSLEALIVKSALAIFSMIVTFLLGLSGNGLVIWVAGFYTPCTVNTAWYLNLAVADLTIILSLCLQFAMWLCTTTSPLADAL